MVKLHSRLDVEAIDLAGRPDLQTYEDLGGHDLHPLWWQRELVPSFVEFCSCGGPGQVQH